MRQYWIFEHGFCIIGKGQKSGRIWDMRFFEYVHCYWK